MNSRAYKNLINEGGEGFAPTPQSEKNHQAAYEAEIAANRAEWTRDIIIARSAEFHAAMAVEGANQEDVEQRLGFTLRDIGTVYNL